MSETTQPENDQTKITIETILGLLIHELNGSVGVGITGSSFIADITADLSQQITSGSISTEDLKNRLAEIHEVSEAMQLSLMNHSDTIFVARDRLFSLCDVDEYPANPFDILNWCWNQQNQPEQRIILENHLDPNLRITAKSGVLETIFTQLIQNTFNQVKSLQDQSKGLTFKAESVLLPPDQSNPREEDSGPSLVLLVQDDGPGLELDTLSVHPSKPQFLYKQMPRPRLGLSIVHRLVTRYLRGTVQFDSKSGKGFSTRITLTHNIESK